MFGIAGDILGGLQTAYGLWQNYQGTKMANANKRPTYEIPQEIQDNLTQAQQMALQGLPEEQKTQYLNNLQRSQQFGLNSISDRKGGLSGIAGIVQGGNDASMNLLSADSQARKQNQLLEMQQRTNLAGYKDKAFELNKLNPYYEKAAAARQMQGAGLQNINTGLSTVAGITDRNKIFKSLNKDNDTGVPGTTGSNGLQDYINY